MGINIKGSFTKERNMVKAIITISTNPFMKETGKKTKLRDLAK